MNRAAVLYTSLASVLLGCRAEVLPELEVGPVALLYMASAADPSTGHVYLAGGRAPNIGSGAEAAWEYSAGVYRSLSVPCSGVVRGVGAFDSRRSLFYVFGGIKLAPVEGRSVTSDLCAFDARRRFWFHVDVEGPRPSPRFGAAMTYDPTADRLVLWGGLDADGEPVVDDAVWGYSEGRWTKLGPGGGH